MFHVQFDVRERPPSNGIGRRRKRLCQERRHVDDAQLLSGRTDAVAEGTASSTPHSSCGLIVKPRCRALDRAFVVGQDDPPAGHRHPLDTDEDPHDRIRAFSGSKIGVDPATATVTG
jgi:hypothetical protein